MQNKILRTIPLLVLGISILNTNRILAYSISPAVNEIKITVGQSLTESFNFRNNSNEDITVDIKIAQYDTQTEIIQYNPDLKLIETFDQTYNIKLNSSKDISYSIKPPLNLPLGTYTYIIQTTEINNDVNLSRMTKVDISPSIAHLVVVHVIDPEGNVKGLTSDNTFVPSIEVVDKGIPFLKPLKIKLTISNSSNYILNPLGEIQVFNKKESYKPTYLKINTSEEKLYPSGTYTEEFSISNWHIQDLISDRKIVAEIYDGVGDNAQIIEEFVPSFRNITLIILFGLISVLLLSKAVKTKKE